MFSKLLLLLIPTVTSCLNYEELPTRCLDCLDHNGNAEMTNFLKLNSSWICTDQLCPPEYKESNSNPLTVDYFSIKSYIKHRYSTTYVMSRITNRHKKDQKAVFSIFIPSRAHISRFIVEIDDKTYDSKINKRQKRSEGKARRTGNEGNPLRKFEIKTKLKPKSTVTYHLVYEELLARKNGKYRVDLNVHPGQIVDNLDVQVLINENQPLRFVKTPVLKKPDELEKNISALNPRAEIVYTSKRSIVVKFQPNRKQQERFVKALKAKVKYGLDVQFRVHYDVQRNAPGGEIIMDDPYFVHFFAPERLRPLPKYVIFAIDTSGSMHGKRMKQLRLSMEKILPQLRPDDLFSIIEFASNIYIVDIANKKGSRRVIHKNEINDYSVFDKVIGNRSLPEPVQATKDNIKEAIKQVKKFVAVAHSNIITSSQLALHMVKRVQRTHKIRYEPLIMLISDGEPSFKYQTKEQALKYVAEYNKNIAPIFSIGISPKVHYSFLRQFSALNGGTAIHIKNTDHVSVLLERFFDVYSTPVLNNIRFLYGINATTLTKTRFTTFYEGTELVVAGKIEGLHFEPQVLARTLEREVHYPFHFSQSRTPLNRIWAYLRTHQNIDDIRNKQVSNKLVRDTLNLALEYSFVTPLSSLTITSPSFGTINDDMLLKPIYQPIKNLKSTEISVAQTKIYRFQFSFEHSNKKMITKS